MPINGKSLADIVKEKKASAPASPVEAPVEGAQPTGGLGARAYKAVMQPFGASTEAFTRTAEALKKAGSSIVGGFRKAGETLGEGAAKPGTATPEGTLPTPGKGMAASMGQDLRTGLRAAGDIAGGVWEGAGDLLGAAYKGLPEPARKSVEHLGKKFLESETGQSAMQVFQQGVEAYGAWKAEHPEEARDFEAAINIIPFATAPLEQAGARVAGRAIAGTAEAAAKATKPVVEAVEGAASKAAANRASSAAAKAAVESTETIQRIFQSTDPKETKALTRALKDLDTTEVKDYATLKDVAEKKQSAILDSLDQKLASDEMPQRWQFSDFVSKEGQSSRNYVDDAVDHLEQLYEKTGDLKGQEYVRTLVEKEAAEGLTLKDVNDLARRYGASKKAFSASGELKETISAQAHENTRKGIKEAFRAKLPDDTAKALDEAASDLYRVIDSSDELAEKALAIKNRLRKPGVWDRVLGAVGGAAIGGATGGIGGAVVGAGAGAVGASSIRDIITNLFSRGIREAGTVNPLQLEKELGAMLKKADKVLGKTDDEGFVKELIKALQSSAADIESGNVRVGMTTQDVSSGFKMFKNRKLADAEAKKMASTGLKVNVREYDPDTGEYILEYKDPRKKAYAPPKEATGEGVPRASKLEDIPEDKSLAGEAAALQKKSRERVFKDEEKLLTQYKEKYGKEINADNFKTLFVDDGYKGTNAAAFHEASSYLAKRAWTEAMKNPEPYAISTAGGSGAGKGSALKNLESFKGLKDEAAAILDSNMSNWDSVQRTIKEAEKAGKTYVHNYVYREPVDAFVDGVIKRMFINKEEMGRLVPASVTAKNHIGAWKVAERLHKEGKALVNFIDNTRGWDQYAGKSNAAPVSYDQLKGVVRLPDAETLRYKLENAARAVYETGVVIDGKKYKLTKQQLNALLGN